MNERIKLLAEQAGVYFGEAHKDYFGEEHPAYISTRDIDVEKFAELIVRECAGKVDWILAEGGRTQGDLIKQHFGVE